MNPLHVMLDGIGRPPWQKRQQGWYKEGRGVVGLLVVSVSLGLSNFAAAVGIGISGVDAQTRLKTGLTFGFFEAVTPILGLLLGSMLAGWLAVLGHYGGAGLLVLTGSYLLLKALRDRGASPLSDGQQVDFHHLLLTGFALSADNLVVGFALGIYHVPIVLAAALIAVVSVSMSLVGLELGNRLGIRFGRGSAALGAVVLILVGFALGLGLLQ